MERKSRVCSAVKAKPVKLHDWQTHSRQRVLSGRSIKHSSSSQYLISTETEPQKVPKEDFEAMDSKVASLHDNGRSMLLLLAP